jgi:hypothetical protein
VSARASARSTRATVVGLAALAAAFATTPLAGQANDASVGAAVSFQSFSFDKGDVLGMENLRLISLHFAASVPIVQQISMGVNGAYARGTMGRGSLDQLEISGLTDTQVSLTFSPNPYFDLTAVALAPTGKETQTLDESVVAAAMASDLLPFSVSNWGTGGGGGASASVKGPLGPVGAGLSVGYIAGREFQPLDGLFQYRPGGLLRIVGAMDATVGGTSKASVKVTYHRYGQDKVDGTNLFQSGDRFQGLASLAFPIGPASSGIAYASVTHRQGSTVLGQLPLANPSVSQNLFLVGGGIRMPVGTAVLQPDAEARVLRRADSTGQGYDLGVGVKLELRSGRGLFAPSARVHFGNVDLGAGDSSSLLGFEVGLTARVGGGS